MGRPSRLAVALALLAGAAAIRARGLREAFPPQDETQAVATALYLETTGASVPPSANWPPFFYGCLRGVFRALRVLGAYDSTDDIVAEFGEGWNDRPLSLHARVRALSLACGVALAAVAYALARAVSGNGAALAALAAVAVSPLAVSYSRYALTEGPNALLSSLAVLLALRSLDGRRLPALALSFGFAGVAFATKYLGGLAALAPAFAAFRHGARLRAFALGGVAFLAGAFLAGPSLFLEPRPYLDWMLKHRESTGWEWFGFEGASAGWLHHARHTLPLAIGGIAALALAAWGAVVLARRDPRRTVLLALYPVVLFAVAGASRILFARYLLPLVPFLAAFFGVGLVEAARGVSRGRSRVAGALGAVVASVVLAFPASRAIDQAAALAAEDTRREAARWIEANLPEGAKVLTAFPFVVPGYPFLPWSAYPPVRAARYDFGNLTHPLDRRFLSEVEAAGFEFFVWTSFVDGVFEEAGERYPEFDRFYGWLRERGEPLARFDPGCPREPGVPFPELEVRGVLGRGCARAGPEIRVLRLR